MIKIFIYKIFFKEPIHFLFPERTENDQIFIKLVYHPVVWYTEYSDIL